jgi:hypothetical protein
MMGWRRGSVCFDGIFHPYDIQQSYRGAPRPLFNVRETLNSVPTPLGSGPGPL